VSRRGLWRRSQQARRATFLLGAAVLMACATRSDFEAAVARSRSLEHELRRREGEMIQVRRRNAALTQVGSRLKLERESLDTERIELLGEIEELREEYEQLQAALRDEQRLREQRETEIQQLSGTYQNLVDELEREVSQGQVEIHQLRGRLQVRALDQILFPSGSSDIKPEGRELLRRIAAQLARIDDHRIRIEGHTDNVPISTERFPSNWELSVGRAVGVVRLLSSAGLPEKRLSAEGFGPYQPIDSNGSARGRARNRRIEIVLVPEPKE